MPPDRSLLDATPGQPPPAEHVQQLIEAESGQGTQGILRSWQASDSDRVVLISNAAGVQISRDNGTTAPAQVIVDGTQAGGALTGTYPNPTLEPIVVDALVPPGTIWSYAGVGVPTGWLPCDGVLRATASFPKLFAAIGYTYGGSGASFATPDLVGRVILGVSGAHPRGQAGGGETAAGPLHSHPGSHSHGPGVHTHAQGAHTHDAGAHVHGLNSHRHDIGHNHASATAAALAPALVTGVHEGPSAVVNVASSVHTHDVDLPNFPVTDSGVPSTTDTLGPSAVTGGVTAGAATVGTPSANATAPDTSAHDASYGAVTVPTMPPFAALAYMIRTG